MAEIRSTLQADDHVPVSEAEWRDWLLASDEITHSVYRLKPSQLVADYNRERAISRDYEGREILELLQNASDAAAASDQPGRVYIELTPDYLIVANTGRCFSYAGAASLQTSDLSPKRDRRKKQIGNKGLGFRSILNWSMQPLILSGKLRLGFSSSHAREVVQLMAAREPAIAARIEEEARIGYLPAPTLPFPIWLDGGNEHVKGCAGGSRILERADACIKAGYSTVIGMPFDKKDAYTHALAQVEGLRPEFLLFTNTIHEIAIHCQREPERIWKRSADVEGRVSIQAVSGESVSSSRWQIFERKGDIPPHLLRDPTDPAEYSIVVALPEAEDASPTFLYSYFPTSVMLPLPLLCHATLELEQNRKHFQQSESNAYILGELANHLLAIAEQVAPDDASPWRGLDLIKPVTQVPAPLAPLFEQIIVAARDSRIIPTLGGGVVSPAQAYSLRGASAEWLPRHLFGDIAASRNNSDLDFFAKIGVPALSPEQFRSRISGETNLPISTRAEIVSGIIQNGLSTEFHHPSLLLDADAKALSEDDRIFLPPEGGTQHISMPRWINVRILNNDLWQALRSRLEAGSARSALRLLEGFGVQEYALGNLASALTVECNRSIKQQPERNHEVRLELILALHSLFPASVAREKRPKFPEGAQVQVLSQTGAWLPAEDAYFGEPYGRSGTVMQMLMSASLKKVVAAPEAFGMNSTTIAALKEFMLWIGVNEWPREVGLKQPPGDFLRHVLQKIHYPAHFEGDLVYSMQSTIPRPKIEGVKSLDGLDAILKAPPAAILAWLALDPRVENWTRLDEKHGVLVCQPPRLTRRFLGPIPSYIHWRIKSTAWLPCTNGAVMAPLGCMLGDRALDGIFPRPAKPSADEIERFGLDFEDLQRAQIKAGVPLGLSTLDSEEIYALLLDLPRRSPDGKVARTLYNWLLSESDFIPDAAGTNYRRFKDVGKMWGKRSGIDSYYPVKESMHVDIDGLPPTLIDALTIANLPKRRGTEKVAKLFSLRSIARSSVTEKVESFTTEGGSEHWNVRFQECKPFIRILRHAYSSQHHQLDQLIRLHLEVCSSVSTVVTYDGTTISHQLGPWSFSIDGDVLYIRCEFFQGTGTSLALLASVIGDAVASVFGISDGSAFAQLFQCETESRRLLLTRLVGDEQQIDIDERLAELERELDVPPTTIFMPSGALAASPKENQDNAGGDSTHGLLKDPETGGNREAGENSPWITPTAIVIQPAPDTPSPVPGRIGIKVGSPGTSGGGKQSGRQPVHTADGAVGEELAELFEAQAGRFPLRVGHITGFLAPGCDLLSFRTEADREAFERGADRRDSLVERFIEAKARTGGLIELTPNEWSAAKQRQDRYFIYRVQQNAESPEDYLLTILQNPSSATEAHVHIVQLALDRAVKVQRFKLKACAEKEKLSSQDE